MVNVKNIEDIERKLAPLAAADQLRGEPRSYLLWEETAAQLTCGVHELRGLTWGADMS